jgi:hypothetical protein
MATSSVPDPGDGADSRQRLVKVRVRFRPEMGGPGSETLWAEPVEAGDAGGTYRLANTGFVAILAVDDVVRAELDGDGFLQVVDIVEPADRCVTGLMVEGPTVTRQVLDGLVDELQVRGAEASESAPGFLVSTWRLGMTEPEIRAAVAEAVRAAPGPDDALVTLVDCFTPADRTREKLDDVDFELVREPTLPPVTTSYWAAADPVWENLGLAEPAFLARVQILAGQDARVARALERGQHDRVLAYLERLSAEDPAGLAPLDSPLFEP